MGKKRYNQKNNVGKAKYVISYHDGKKKHKDGSDFFDIQIFRNKKDLAKFVNTLHKAGYVYGFNESVNENKKEIIALRKKAKSEKAFYDVLDTIEKKYGKRSFEGWLDKSLRDLRINPKKYRTSAEKQEALYQAKL